MDADENTRHAEKMAKIKAARDRMMQGKTGEKGLVIVHTGKGKGKSSSGFGMILRAIAHDMPCAVVQFIKGAWDTGERRLIEENFSELCQFHVMGEGFTWETQDRQRDIEKAQAAWLVARELLRDESIHLIVLDELNIALKHGYLQLDDVLADITARPTLQHVVVTGRGVLPGMVDAADTVTEMNLVKHAFKAGVKAQKGIEF